MAAWLNKSLLALVLVGASFVLSLSLFAEDEVYAEYPELTAPKKNNEAQVQRGAYLTKAGDCIACHTQVGGAAFAGGLALVTPFGTFYTPNITPDKQNGIGSWTDAQFFKSYAPWYTS